MNVDDLTPDSGGGGDENDQITVRLTDDGFDVRILTGDGTTHTAFFSYPMAAYPCADKGGADRARARTEAGVIEIRVKCNNGEEEIYTFRYEVSGR